MLEWLGAIGGIVLVDLVLSGDNALVIGAAASSLPRRQRVMAIVLGGGGAIVLRILFAVLATLLLRLPLLQALGGVMLIYIAVRLLAERTGKDENEIAERGEVVPHPHEVHRGMRSALLTILVADVTMSLDNVLAVGALAAGNLPVLVGGLLLSITLVMVGSALVAELIQRLPWLLDVAALVLGWTAAHMILTDLRLGPVLHQIPPIDVLIPVLVMALVLGCDLWFRFKVEPGADRGAGAPKLPQ